MQILIVEDENKLALALQQGLVEEGYAAEVALSGEEALERLGRGHPDLVLLDVMLPKRNGLGVLRELRKDGFHVPVLLLTALDSVQDRVLGLDARCRRLPGQAPSPFLSCSRGCARCSGAMPRRPSRPSNSPTCTWI